MSAAERASEASSAEQANAWAVQANERMEEQMAQSSLRRFRIILTHSKSVRLSNLLLIKWQSQPGKYCEPRGVFGLSFKNHHGWVYSGVLVSKMWIMTPVAVAIFPLVTAEPLISLNCQFKYQVILEKVSFGIFRTIFISKEEKNFNIKTKTKSYLCASFHDVWSLSKSSKSDIKK